MARVGLVLGGGGVLGQAFHAGTLAALEHDIGWDARDAEVIVGTSAGALGGAALRSGVPASALAAWCVGAPLWGVASELAARTELGEYDPFSLSQLRFGLPDRALLARVLRRPWEVAPVTALA